MSQLVRVPEEHGGIGVGCYKFDAKAFTLSSFLVVIEAVCLVFLRNHLLDNWTSPSSPVVCSILGVIAVTCSFIAFAGYVCAFVSACEYCAGLRSANQ